MRRNLRNNLLGGVLAGIEDATGIDVSILRIVAVLLGIGSIGTALLVYLVAWIIIPARS